MKIYPDPDSKEWENLANKMARYFCPTIYPCKTCNYPVVSGYCCTECKDNDPSSKDDERE